METTPFSFPPTNSLIVSATIARFIQTSLGLAGDNIFTASIFTAHLTRHASLSKGNNEGLSLRYM